MQKETIIQSITVGQNLQQTYVVGDVIDFREVIEIRKYADSHGCEYHVLDEEENAIVIVSYLPALEEYKKIAIDGPAEQPSLMKRK